MQLRWQRLRGLRRLREHGGLCMTSTVKASLFLVGLLAVPAVASGAQGRCFDDRRMSAEIRREVREAQRDARRMRWDASREVRRDVLRARLEARRTAREAVREARRA